jgi:hypothetical protein
MKKPTVSFLGLIILGGCNDGGSSALPSLQVDPRKRGGDFTINIAQTKKISNEKTLYTCLSRYEDKPVQSQ